MPASSEGDKQQQHGNLKTALTYRLQLKVLLNSLEAKIKKLFTGIPFTHGKESLASFCPQTWHTRIKWSSQGQRTGDGTPDSQPQEEPLCCMRPFMDVLTQSDFFFFFNTRGEEGLHYSKSVDIMSLQLRHIFSLTLTIQHTRCIKKTVKNSRSEGLGDTFPPPLSTSPQTSSECPMASWTKGPLLTLPEAPAWNPQGAPQQLGTEDTQCSGCPGPS